MLVNKITEALDHAEIIFGVFLDISNAFDSVTKILQKGMNMEYASYCIALKIICLMGGSI